MGCYAQTDNYNLTMNITIYKYPERAEWERLQQRPELDVTSLFDTVREVLDDVRMNGDEAIRMYGERFDKVRVAELQVSAQEICESESLIDEDLRDAIIIAHQNILKLHDT